jgi:uncharacterized membrane protein
VRTRQGDLTGFTQWMSRTTSVPTARREEAHQSVATDPRALSSTSASSSVTSRARLEAVDVVRGVIMILMALDHTRDFFGIPGTSPTNLAQASAPLFLTRWVTHFCAPVFFLLAGTGARLSLGRRSIGDLSRFLLTRGIWLIVAELVLARCFAYQFNVDYQITLLLVLWAAGWAMITLAGLVHLPVSAVTAIGALLIAGHNLFDPVTSTNPLWTILHQQRAVLSGDLVVFVAYPLIPWIGVTAVGYGLGQLYSWSPDERRAWLLRLGLATCLAFVVIRGINGYGDPRQWMPQPTALFTVLSFLNATKQPSSLVYLLMTLGPALLFLWAVDGRAPRLLRPALTFGRVPLFYYLTHFALLHALAVVVCYLRYGTAHWMFESPDLAHYPFSPPPGWGFTLPVVYLWWTSVVLAMYPLCAWFGRLKLRRNDAWLSYL